MIKKKRNTNRCISKEYFDMLYQQHYIMLCRYAFYITKRKDIAEEVVQEVFMKIWNKRKNIDFETDPKYYLYRSVKNISFNKLKHENKKEKNEFEFELKPDNNTEFNQVAFKEKLQLAINQLPAKCREIYCLKHLEGLTYKEISGYLNLSEKTVESQVYNALVKLRQLLKPHLHEFYSNEQYEK